MSHSKNPGQSLLQIFLIRLIGVYRRWVSPLLPRACRFYPSCSEYASEAVETHGVARGSVLAASRLVRCHPWCEGGVDPVPPRDGSPATSAVRGRA
jgi:putative membrane protein insertion efficiency factor